MVSQWLQLQQTKYFEELETEKAGHHLDIFASKARQTQRNANWPFLLLYWSLLATECHLTLPVADLLETWPFLTGSCTHPNPGVLFLATSFLSVNRRTKKKNTLVKHWFVFHYILIIFGTHGLLFSPCSDVIVAGILSWNFLTWLVHLMSNMVIKLGNEYNTLLSIPRIRRIRVTFKIP